MTGWTRSQTISISNNTQGSLTLSEVSVVGASFIVEGIAAPITIAPGHSLPFHVKFSPTWAGLFTGSVTLITSGLRQATISLAGTGVTANLTLTPSTLNFGNTATGDSSSLPVRVTNTGTSSITIVSLALTGKGFTISDLNLPLKLTVNQSVSFTVNFAPVAAEAYTGTVSLNSDTAESVTSELLSGTGADAHSVSLTWAASTSPGVAGYNIYRSLQSGGPYTLLAASPVPGTSYTDDTVEGATTYYYVVTAVASGSQSIYSNEAEATVPKDSSSTALTSSLNPSTYNQSVSFTATVTSSGGTPTGTVTFKDGSITLGTMTLSSGKATFTTKALSVGSHSITGVYGGSTDFSGSTSLALTQTVKQAGSSTALTSSRNPSTYNQSVTFTATVTSSGGTPTGTVTFKDGSIWLGAGTLSSGKTTFTTKALSVGSHSITAVYGGRTDFSGSTSPVLTQTVKAFTTTTALTSSLNPSVTWRQF